jgi:hypothetical protein
MGKTFGSLIRVPEELAEKLPASAERVPNVLAYGGMLEQGAAMSLGPLIAQSRNLVQKYNCVVANPPYMGSKGMNTELKEYARQNFPDSKSDLCAMFMERGFELTTNTGHAAMVTMQSWMFLSSYEEMRQRLLGQKTLQCMVHMSNGVMGIAFGTAATIFDNFRLPNDVASFSYVDYSDLNEDATPREFPIKNNRLKNVRPDDFKKIPGSPVAYWASLHVRLLFSSNPPLANAARSAKGLDTCDNDRFMRAWFEVSTKHLSLDSKSTEYAKRSGARWFPYCKGGDFRKWYGNLTVVVDWKDDGQVLKALKTASGKSKSFPRNTELYFRHGITFSALTSAVFSCRIMKSAIFGGGGSALFSKDLLYTTGFLNSKLNSFFLDMLNPTMNMLVGDLDRLPFLFHHHTLFYC